MADSRSEATQTLYCVSPSSAGTSGDMMTEAISSNNEAGISPPRIGIADGAIDEGKQPHLVDKENSQRELPRNPISPLTSSTTRKTPKTTGRIRSKSSSNSYSRGWQHKTPPRPSRVFNGQWEPTSRSASPRRRLLQSGTIGVATGATTGRATAVKGRIGYDATCSINRIGFNDVDSDVNSVLNSSLDDSTEELCFADLQYNPSARRDCTNPVAWTLLNDGKEDWHLLQRLDSEAVEQRIMSSPLSRSSSFSGSSCSKSPAAVRGCPPMNVVMARPLATRPVIRR